MAHPALSLLRKLHPTIDPEVLDRIAVIATELALIWSDTARPMPGSGAKSAAATPAPPKTRTRSPRPVGRPPRQSAPPSYPAAADGNTPPPLPNNGVSRAQRARQLLEVNPMTAPQLTQALEMDPSHIHPMLASIGARAVGTWSDQDGHEYKTYGFVRE